MSHFISKMFDFLVMAYASISSLVVIVIIGMIVIYAAIGAAKTLITEPKEFFLVIFFTVIPYVLAILVAYTLYKVFNLPAFINLISAIAVWFFANGKVIDYEQRRSDASKGGHD